MVCCGFIVCWAPNEVSFFLNFVGYAIDFGGWFYHFTSYTTSLCLERSPTSPRSGVADKFLFWFYHFTVVLTSGHSDSQYLYFL